MKIIGTGLSGLVGSRVVELLSPFHTFINYSLENGFDITNREDIISRIVRETDVAWVIHMAAYTDVQQAESDKSLGEQSTAWRVNVLATENIITACRKAGKRLLYVDTDYAFDGTRKEYTEEDTPSPQGWYAVTKSEGAKRVLTLGDKGLVIRISNPYRANPVGKKDFVHKMLDILKSGREIIAPSDQLFVPTFIDDIAAAVQALVTTNASGIYHVVGSEALSPFTAAKVLAEIYGIDNHTIIPTTFGQYFQDRVPIPRYAVLRSDKIRGLGVNMRGFRDGISVMRNQESKKL